MIVCVLCVLLHSARAETLGGVSMPDTKEVGGTTLVLNGMGIREATVFKVNVYVMGLYLESKCSDPEEIVSSDETKHVTMEFVRKVDKEKHREGWRGGFTNNNDSLEPVQKDIDKFIAVMGDVVKGDRITIDWVDTRVDVVGKGTQVLTIDNPAFQKALLRVWLGPKPPNPGIKKGILGN
jgi:hypothetical protein